LPVTGSFVKVEVEDPLPTNNPLPTHEAKAPLIENVSFFNSPSIAFI
jgi:hypothetical protein